MVTVPPAGWPVTFQDTPGLLRPTTGGEFATGSFRDRRQDVVNTLDTGPRQHITLAQNATALIFSTRRLASHRSELIFHDDGFMTLAARPENDGSHFPEELL